MKADELKRLASKRSTNNRVNMLLLEARSVASRGNLSMTVPYSKYPLTEEDVQMLQKQKYTISIVYKSDGTKCVNLDWSQVTLEDTSPIIASSEIFRPYEFVQRYIGDAPSKVHFISDLRDYLDEEGHSDLWDKPLTEIDEVLEQGQQVVLVYDGREARWFEIPE